jgi:hypothetical protein
MNPALRKNERELVKLTRFFRKRAESFTEEGKLTEEQKQKIVESCENLEKSLDIHATYREAVMQRREGLQKSVQDNAACPKCGGRTQLKLVGIATHDRGWKSNKYRCRKCNIEFVWNRPNNPWDMLPFIESMIDEIKGNLAKEDINEEEKRGYEAAIESMYQNLERMKPVLESSDQEFAELEQRDKEMARTVHEFTNYLMIEKIRMNVFDDGSENN